jgi:hypothetical protein
MKKLAQILIGGEFYKLLSGERGIRTPGGITLNGFQDRRIKPLCHLSGAKIGVEKQ